VVDRLIVGPHRLGWGAADVADIGRVVRRISIVVQIEKRVRRAEDLGRLEIQPRFLVRMVPFDDLNIALVGSATRRDCDLLAVRVAPEFGEDPGEIGIRASGAAAQVEEQRHPGVVLVHNVGFDRERDALVEPVEPLFAGGCRD
jgi:hypothetical protein